MGNFSRKWIKDLLLSKGARERERSQSVSDAAPPVVEEVEQEVAPPDDPIRDKSESFFLCVIINGTLFF